MITVEIGEQQDAGHGNLGGRRPTPRGAGTETEAGSVDGQLHPDSSSSMRAWVGCCITFWIISLVRWGERADEVIHVVLQEDALAEADLGRAGLEQVLQIDGHEAGASLSLATREEMMPMPKPSST